MKSQQEWTDLLIKDVPAFNKAVAETDEMANLSYADLSYADLPELIKVPENLIGPAAAGALITIQSCPYLEGKVPNWYATDEDALEDIKRCAKIEKAILKETVEA